MIIGIIGLASILVCCGIGLIASPFALFMGRSAKKRIEASNGSLSGEGQANAGFITGIIGTVFLVLGVLGAIAYVVFMVWLASSGNLDSPSTYDSYDSEF